MLKRFIMVAFACLAVGVQAFAQNVVTGKVIDAKGEPVIGAGVQIKGSTTGVATDLDGAFNIRVADNAIQEKGQTILMLHKKGPEGFLVPLPQKADIQLSVSPRLIHASRPPASYVLIIKRNRCYPIRFCGACFSPYSGTFFRPLR